METAKWLDRKVAIKWVVAQVFERCSTLSESFEAVLYLQGYQYTNQCKDSINVPVFFEGRLTARQQRQLFNDVCKEMDYNADAQWRLYQSSNDAESTPESITEAITVTNTQVTESNVITVESNEEATGTYSTESNPINNHSIPDLIHHQSVESESPNNLMNKNIQNTRKDFTDP